MNIQCYASLRFLSVSQQRLFFSAHPTRRNIYTVRIQAFDILIANGYITATLSDIINVYIIYCTTVYRL